LSDKTEIEFFFVKKQLFATLYVKTHTELGKGAVFEIRHAIRLQFLLEN